MQIALVHDWVTGFRGGERVLHELALLYPDADLYTLVHAPGTSTPEIDRLTRHTSPLSLLPGAARHYRVLLPLFPWAIEQFRPRGYDLVISVSHAVAKGIRVEPGTPHLCYCLTPMRYIWDQADAYLGRGARRALAAPLLAYLRSWDRRSSGTDRVTRFVATSSAVAARIKTHYARDADIVFPPVDVERIRPGAERREGFYLLVGAFVPYKREDLAIRAFERLDAPLLIAGSGPLQSRLKRGAPRNVRFLGRVSDAELARLYQRCRALIYPQEEDFGIVAVEAQAAGTPVIAFGRGGARDTIVPFGSDAVGPPTGVLFWEQTPGALLDAVHRYEAVEHTFQASEIRKHAERFNAPRFRREIAELSGAFLR